MKKYFIKILLPSQQVMIFQQEYNSLKQVVLHTMKEIQRLNNEKKEILAINFVIFLFLINYNLILEYHKRTQPTQGFGHKFK